MWPVRLEFCIEVFGEFRLRDVEVRDPVLGAGEPGSQVKTAEAFRNWLEDRPSMFALSAVRRL
jgi:hypothetical protein